MMFRLWLFVSLAAYATAADLGASPCPRLFQYENDSDHQQKHGKWDGTLTLISDSDLYGVWIRVIFDLPSTELKVQDSFGDVVTEDHKEYLIKNRNHVLKAGEPAKVGITVKYEGDKAPRLIGYRLNARPVCPEQDRNEEWVENTNPASTSYFLGDLNNKEFLPSVTTFPQVPDCGTIPLSKDSISAKTQKTSEGQWPWQASIFLKNQHSESYVCGATLISPKVLLTAAHCVTKKNTESPVESDLLTIHLGRFYLKTNSSKQQVAGLESIVPHPGYNSRNLRNDIAMIKLQKAVVIDDYVRPVCLSQEIGDDAIRREGFVVGFGFDDQKRYTNKLNLAKFQIEDDKDCWEKHPQLETLLNDKTLCASFTHENSICVGDSGNGLVLTKGGSKPIWELKGIVTYGVALQNKYLCDKSSSILMADVSKYLKWIYTNIS